MGSFVDAMLSMLFGWLQALINWIWGIIDRGGSALGTWFLQNWIPLTLILIVGGLVVDWFIWLIRWRPYHVWGTRLRRIGRIFRRSDKQDTGNYAYAEGYVPEEETYPESEDAPEYLNTFQTEVYTPAGAQASNTDDFPGDTYVEPQASGGYLEDPDFYPEEMEAADGENPDADIAWIDWDAVAAAEDDDLAADGEMTADPPAWSEEETEAEPAYSAQDAESFAYRELLPLDDDTYDEPGEDAPEGDEPLLDEDAEMEDDEEMYDDFSNHGAPEPPQKRRRWEFSEDDAPATSRRRSAPDTEEDADRRNARSPSEGAAPRRRRDTVEEPSGIDPLAAYDAPEVMEQMQQGQSTAYPDEAEGAAAPRRRRRSQRRRSGASEESSPDNRAYEEYLEESPPDNGYDVEPEATPAPRRGRSGRRGRGRSQAQDYVEAQNSDFAEEPYYEEPYYEEALPRSAYSEDDYYSDDPYAEDLPDSPDWPNWEEEPDLPRGQRNRGVTKPSLIDRLRGMASPTRSPRQEKDEEYYDDEPYDDPYYDDEFDEVEEVPPKKKGLFSRFLNPEQSEYQQSKPKPRVRQEDAYNEPIYPPKKRR